MIAGDTLAASQGGNRVAPFVDRCSDRAGYAETRASVEIFSKHRRSYCATQKILLALTDF